MARKPQDPKPSEQAERGSNSRFAERLHLESTFSRVMNDRYKEGMELGDSNQRRASEDLNFLLGHQWTAQEKTERAGRPTEADNKLPPSYHQLKNDLRQNLPAPKLRPRGDAHADTGLILDGLLRYIGNRSNAVEHRIQAAGQAMSGGFGYYYATKEYTSDTGFEQEVRIKPLPNFAAVVDDWTAREPDMRDRRFLFVVDRLPEEEFKARYPHNAVIKSPTLEGQKIGSNWGPHEVPEILYWWREIKGWKTLISKTERDPETGELVTRDVPEWRVCWMLTNAQEVLLNKAGQPLRGEWDGQWIPYLLVAGWRELVMDEKGRATWHLEGAFHQARTAQRLGNYTKMAMMEVIGQQPKTKWMIPEGADEGHEAEFENINTSPKPGLHYKPSPGPNGTVLKPEAVPPATLGDALPLAIQWADGAVRDATGMFQGAKGEATNDPSGYALQQRRVENDTNHLHFMAHLAVAMKFEAEICVDLICASKLYGRDSKVWIAFGDGSDDQQVLINSEQPDPAHPKSTWSDMDENGQPRKHYDLSVGKFEVTMEIGPNFATQREEQQAGMLETMRVYPQSAPIIMPSYVKAAAWKDADRISQALLTLVPPAAAQALSQAPLPSDAATVQQLRQALLQQQQIVQSLVPALQQLQEQVKSKRLEQIVKLVMESEKVTGEKLRAVSHLVGTQMKAEADVVTTAIKGHQEMAGAINAQHLEQTRREGQSSIEQDAAQGTATAQAAASQAGGGAPSGGAGPGTQPANGAGQPMGG